MLKMEKSTALIAVLLTPALSFCQNVTYPIYNLPISSLEGSSPEREGKDGIPLVQPIWRAVKDQSRKKQVSIHFSSQGSEMQRMTAGALPHKVQALYVVAENISSENVEFVPLSVYRAAITAGFQPLGPEVYSLIVRGTVKRSKPETLKRVAPLVSAGVTLGMALSGVQAEAQAVSSGTSIGIALLSNGAQARQPEPGPIMDNLIRQSTPVVLKPGMVLSGYIGALFDPSRGASAVGVMRYADGSDTIFDAMVNK